MKILTPLSAAMDFLTRLAPARIHDDATIAASVKYFPVAGMVVGTVCTAPFALGVLRGHPWLQAWLLLCLNLWITRGLHWDGMADIADAWGASGDTQRFWTVIKDSRIGAFGGMALVLGWAASSCCCTKPPRRTPGTSWPSPSFSDVACASVWPTHRAAWRAPAASAP